MIKLFRNIRQNLLAEGKTSKYLKYAIGEIILVVIGILIALALNNWNENRVKNLQERQDLQNLKEELKYNILDFNSLDSLYSVFEQRTDLGLKLFNNNPKVVDFIEIDSFINTRLKVFPLTRSTYDEMLNTGKFYNLKNKELKANITRFYSESENYSEAFLEINKDVLKIINHNDLYKYDLLISHLKINSMQLAKIDTSWVHNINSPTYLAFFKRANYIQEYSNRTRRELMGRQNEICKELVTLIDAELGNKRIN